MESVFFSFSRTRGNIDFNAPISYTIWFYEASAFTGVYFSFSDVRALLQRCTVHEMDSIVAQDEVCHLNHSVAQSETPNSAIDHCIMP